MVDRKNDDYLYEARRLVEISDALRSLQKKSKQYIDEYEKSSTQSYLIRNFIEKRKLEEFQTGISGDKCSIKPKRYNKF